MDSDIIRIDGTLGEGGGQLLRSSLALSLVTGKSFVIENIRGGREKPGLQNQHLLAVNAAAKISNAKVEGNVLYSTRIVFKPDKISGGNYFFSVETAGSMTLVLHAILPALILADSPSTIKFQGGTHNQLSPPFDHLVKTFLPIINKLGPTVTANLEKYGFFPAGGGIFTVNVQPVKQLKTFELLERGSFSKKSVNILIANLNKNIATRELQMFTNQYNFQKNEVNISNITNCRGPGNVIIIEAVFSNCHEVFTGFGVKGVPAETVVKGVYNEYESFMKLDAPVGVFTADQIMLPLAIAAWQKSGKSTYKTAPLSNHSKTHLELLKLFLGVQIEINSDSSGIVTVQISP